MSATDLVNLSGLMDDAKCFALVRQHRWPDGICCPGCNSSSVIRDGCDDTQPHHQRYRCKACASRFDDLTGLDAASRHLPPENRFAVVLAGHHQPLRVWVLCLYFMGLNLSNRQIAGELVLAVSDVQAMTEQLRRGLVAKTLAVELTGEVEPDARASSGIDEVYVVAGHKGQTDEVAKRGGSSAAASWPACRDAARWRRTSHPSQSDLARRRGGPAHVGQRATGHNQADHHGRGRLGHPRPPRRIQHLRAPARLGLRAQDGLPCARRIRSRRGRRRLLRGPRQHHGRLLVAAAFLAPPTSGHLTGQAAALPRLFPVRAQSVSTRQGLAWRPHRRPSWMT